MTSVQNTGAQAEAARVAEKLSHYPEPEILAAWITVVEDIHYLNIIPVFAELVFASLKCAL